MLSENTDDLSWSKNNTSLEDDYSSPSYNTINATVNCTKEYCIPKNDYLTNIEDYIFPTLQEWIFISFYGIVFIFGITGNAAVCIFVYKNRNMRTVTNLFLANLAMADFMVILLCLPPTVLWNVTNTWFFGGVMCKIVLYLQSVSVSVSILTLTFIAVDRWYAICYPLLFKTTTARAKSLISIIWILSLLLVLPEAIFLDVHPYPDLPADSYYFTNCDFTWTKKDSTIYQIYITLILYVVPLVLMSLVYYQIVKVLWTNTTPSSAEISNGNYSSVSGTNEQSANERINKHKHLSCNCEAQIRSRRKAAKMLICIVFIFAVCYLPVHVINVLRYTIIFPENDVTSVISLISHWLCYANSASNPVIYNFMNAQFRKEFRRVFGFKWLRNKLSIIRSSTSSLRNRLTRTYSIEHGNGNIYILVPS